MKKLLLLIMAVVLVGCGKEEEEILTPEAPAPFDEEEIEKGEESKFDPQIEQQRAEQVRRMAQERAAEIFNLGMMHLNGGYSRSENIWYKKNNKEAAKWFRIAAEQGYAPAQYRLGNMCNLGMGVPEDFEEALKWFRKAAEQGNADGQSELGFMYFFGNGVRQDLTEAVKWFRMAAERGNFSAQLFLADSYAGGYGGSQRNDVVAYAWYIIAAAGGSEQWKRSEYKTPQKIKDKITRNMTAEQIIEAQKLSREMHKKNPWLIK